jgi:hypothetical protein
MLCLGALVCGRSLVLLSWGQGRLSAFDAEGTDLTDQTLECASPVLCLFPGCEGSGQQGVTGFCPVCAAGVCVFG